MKITLFVRGICGIVLAALLISCGAPAATPAPAPTPTISMPTPTMGVTPTIAPTATATATPIPQLELEWKLTGDPNAFKSPVGIALDTQGDIFVMDTANYRIQKFDSQGKFLSMWGSQGSGEGQFQSLNPRFPVGYLAVDHESNVYVIDSLNFRIQKFDNNGNYQTQWGTQGTGDGQFNAPVDVSIDDQNNIYVGDHDNDTVQKFDSTGKLMLRWGTHGLKDGQLAGIFSIAVDADGSVLVAEQGGRLQRFDSNGNFISRIPLEPVDGHSISPWNIAIDKQGNIYIGDNGFRIVKVDPQGKFLATWSPDELGPVISRNLIDMTVDEQGNIYLVDNSANTVYKFRQPGF